MAKVKKVKGLSQDEIKKKVKKEGWLIVKMIFEMVGKPKEHIEKTLKAYMTNIKTDERVHCLSEEYAPVEKTDDGDFFTGFCDADLLVQNLETLNWLMVNFMPASIEILEPAEFKLEARHIQNWLNDMVAKLHEISGNVRQGNNTIQFLTKNMNALIQNMILMAVSGGASTTAEISKKVGIPEEQLKPFFEHMIKNGQLALNGKKYEKA